jgi:hypothetical protein
MSIDQVIIQILSGLCIGICPEPLGFVGWPGVAGVFIAQSAASLN